MTEKPKAMVGILMEAKGGVPFYPAAQMDAHLDALLRFFRHYAVLDGEQRRGVCARISRDNNGQPIAWLMAYREISHSTELGAAILKELDEKKVI